MYFPDYIRDITNRVNLWWYDDPIDGARHFVSRNTKEPLTNVEKGLIVSYLTHYGFALKIIFDN